MAASKPLRSVLSFGMALLPCAVGYAQQLPSGGSVVAGSATITQSGQNQTINQVSDRAIINWQNFSIGAGNTVRFNQPGSSSIVLNRVIGNDPSNIFGNLSANGQVFLVNPFGVYFGAGAVVDVGGLLATTMNIRNEDFMAGNYVFNRDSSAAARREVINAGVLKARENGYVVLAGDYAANRGTIQARLGTAALASGSKMTLDINGDSLINFTVNDKAVAELSGVENSGQLLADGGRAIMTASTARELAATSVNNTGLVRAQSTVERNGEIYLSADGGNALVSGTLDASGRAAGQKGGDIKVVGDKVALLDNAVLDASGDTGGGNINVGGNYQGKGPLLNAQDTSVDQNVTIKADALTNGNGGNVVIWADGHTRYQGNISAQGGAQGGDGGNVEVSGKDKLDFRGNVTTLAAKGKTGNLLLDPTNIEVVQSLSATPPADTSQMTVGSLESQLNTNNVTLQTAAAGANSGTITIDDGSSGGGVQWSANTTLTLDAADRIFIKSSVQGSGSGSSIVMKAANGAVQSGSTNITANSMLLTGGGLWNLAGVDGSNIIRSTNNIGTLATNLSGATLQFANNQNLTIGSVGGTNGLTNTNGTTQLFLDGGSRSLTLAQNVNSGDVYFRASGGVNQTAGTVTANTLALVGGAATLNQSGNNVGTLAANINGTLSYTTTNRLTVGSASGVNGITTNNRDVTIKTGNSTAFTDLSQQPTVSTASLVLRESINAGTGNVRLTTGTGGIFQRHDTNSGGALPNGSITANALLVRGDNTNSVTPFVLTNSANRVNTLAASTNGSISFAGAGNSSTTLTIGSIDGVNGITTTSNTTVSTTTNTDGSVTASTNENNISLSIGGNLNIDRNLTASTATGTDTVSIGMGGDFTTRTASGVRVLADTMGVFGDDLQGTFNITSNVANLVAAGGKVMVINNAAYTGDLTGIGIGAAAASAGTGAGLPSGTTIPDSTSKPVGDFYLTTGGKLNIIKLNSQGDNLLLRANSLSILLDAATKDGARIMLQPYNLANKVGIHNGTDSDFTANTNYSAATLLKFTNPTATFIFGTPQDGILNDGSVHAAAKNVQTGDIHIGSDGAFNLGYRSISAQTSGNLVAHNVGPLYNLRLAAPNLTINGFNTFGPQLHFFSNNLQLPGAAGNYVNPNKPDITLRPLNDETVWIGIAPNSKSRPNETQILSSYIVKLPDGSTIIISGSTDKPFPSGGAGFGDIHIPWNDTLGARLGNRKLILSTGEGVFAYGPTPAYTKKNDGGTSGGLWKGCQDLATCQGENPSPYPDPVPTNDGDGTGSNPGDDRNNDNTGGDGCSGCPPAPPNTDPYPPDTTLSDNNDNNNNDNNNNNNNNNNDNNDNNDNNNNNNNNNDNNDNNNNNNDNNDNNNNDNNNDGDGDGGADTDSGGDGNDNNNNNSAPDNGDGSGNDGDGDGDGNNNNDGADNDGTGNDGGGDGGADSGTGGDGSDNDGDGDGTVGDGDGLDNGGDGNGGADTRGDGNGDGNGGDGGADSGSGDTGDDNDGNGNGNGNGGDGEGDGGAGSGSGGDGEGDGNGSGEGDGDGNGSGDGSDGDGDGDGGAGSGSGGTGSDTGDDANAESGDGLAGDGNGGDGSGNGDGDGGSGRDSGGSGDDADGGEGDGTSTTRAPAAEISCDDVTSGKEEGLRRARGANSNRLVEVNREGVRMRSPCQRQTEPQSKKSHASAPISRN